MSTAIARVLLLVRGLFVKHLGGKPSTGRGIMVSVQDLFAPCELFAFLFVLSNRRDD